MFYQKEFVRGSDGRIYEIEDSNRSGGIMVGVFMVMIAIASAVEQAYLWVLSHYLIMGMISLFIFITWTGWVYHDYQQKEMTKKLGLKFLTTLIILSGFYVSATGFSKSRQESTLRKAIQGEWVQIKGSLAVEIDEKKFKLTDETSKDIVDGDITETKFIAPASVVVYTTAKVYHNGKLNNPETIHQIWTCSVQNDILYMRMPDGTTFEYERE
jgi:hypothetical protein